MSGGLSCICDKESRVHRLGWRVLHRLHNHSAFHGYRYTPSDYSEVGCAKCGRRWRTKALYVSTLPGYCEVGERRKER